MVRGVAFLGVAAALLFIPMPARAAETQFDPGLFLSAEVGPQYLGLQTLKSDNLVNGARVKSKDVGTSYGAGLGVRLLVFTLGARFRYANFSDWQLWTVGAEAGVHFPIGRMEPYFTLGAGYASLEGIHADVSRVVAPVYSDAIDIDGVNVRASVGADFYLSKRFSIGANLAGDLLYLRREGDRLPRTSVTDPNAPPSFPYALDGSGNGVGGTLSFVVGFYL